MGELLGRIVAFLFAGTAVAFGVVVLASWIASLLGYTVGGMILGPITAVPVLALAWRLFVYKSAPGSAAESSGEEQS